MSVSSSRANPGVAAFARLFPETAIPVVNTDNALALFRTTEERLMRPSPTA